MGLAERLASLNIEETAPVASTTEVSDLSDNGNITNRSELKRKVHEELLKKIGTSTTPPAEEYLRSLIRTLLDESTPKLSFQLTLGEREEITHELLDSILRLGPLQELLDDPTITEIMVNGPKQIYVEQRGQLTLSPVTFENDDQVLHVIDRIVTAVGRHCDEASPYVDARLADGSRVNAIIPPIALNGPTITIRKFASKSFGAADLVRIGSITNDMIQFLNAAVVGKCNILVTGGTGAGKTTLLNILSDCIPDNERIITIEDSAELQLKQEHTVSLESRPSNIEGSGIITIRDLIVNALRMRPDRIIVGECRSAETMDMLQAMNTGHDGSLTTAHANTPRDAMSRLESMILMAGSTSGDIPLDAIRSQIASAIQLVVQISRMPDGTRKVSQITEITGMDNGVVQLQDIFKFNQNGFDDEGHVLGRFAATGIRPKCLDRIKNAGCPVDDTWFVG